MIKKLIRHVIGARAYSKISKQRKFIRDRGYQKKLIKLMRDPLSKPQMSFIGHEERLKELKSEMVEKVWSDDRIFLLAGLFSCAGITPDTGDLKLAIQALPSDLKKSVSILMGGESNALECAFLEYETYRGHLPRLYEENYFELKKSQSIAKFIPQFIDRLINKEYQAPKFYEFDYIDDIQSIIFSRYSSGQLEDLKRGKKILGALSAAIGQDEYDDQKFRVELKKLISPDIYIPRRGELNVHVNTVMPEYYDEFGAIRGSQDPARFLQLNQIYSERQMRESGALYARQLSLFRQYERNNLVMLRSLIELIDSKALSADDRVLIIGPRHLDEILFFREVLGFSKVVGLDLFGSKCGSIIEGDMHNMPFAHGEFKLVYMCNTLTYSWNARRVIQEILRVGADLCYVLVIDSGTRVRGPDPLGRSDMMNVDTLIRSFYERPYRILVEDRGRGLAPENYAEQPCCLLEFGRRQ